MDWLDEEEEMVAGSAALFALQTEFRIIQSINVGTKLVNFMFWGGGDSGARIIWDLIRLLDFIISTKSVTDLSFCLLLFWRKYRHNLGTFGL